MRSEIDRQTPLSMLYRNRDMLTALNGGRCTKCGTRQFPKSHICVNPNCGALDTQEDATFANTSGSIVTWSADWLTYTPDPPAHYGMVQFDGGGRMMADFTDVDPGEQDRRLAAQHELRHLLYEHACEGAYGAPEYGGNRDRAGWRAIEFPGDSQPRGYTDEEVSGRA